MLTRWVLDRCTEAGFLAAGVCRASPTDLAAEFRDWLAAGRHGEMAWLADHLDLRLDPRRLITHPATGAPIARSLVLVADRYAAPGHDAPADPAAPPTGRIARYARGQDYHLVIKRRLHALCDRLRAAHPAHPPADTPQFRAFVDTAPVLEREHAARAGLGWVGKHTLLIRPRDGSYFLLGGFATTLDLVPTPDSDRTPDHCGTCTRCIDACPTNAISPYAVDASRCIAYLTIEHRAHIDPQFHPAIGDWLFGCDICQDVCPHNQPTLARSAHPATINPAYAPRFNRLPLLDILGWSAVDRSARLSGSAIKRARLDMLKRNALIVLANHARHHPAAAPAALHALRLALNDPSDLVAQTARDALRALGPNAP